MTINEVIVAHWRGSDLVTGTPIYLGFTPDNLPLGPACLFLLAGGFPIVHHDGEDRTQAVRFQFSGVARNHSDADSIREKTAELLKTLPGTYTGITVQSCVPVSSPRDLYDVTYPRWVCQRDYLLYYTKTGG